MLPRVKTTVITQQYTEILKVEKLLTEVQPIILMN